MSEPIPWEKPAEDAAEQEAEVIPEPELPLRTGLARWDVDPADAAEQEIEVPIDEDEWR